MPLITSSPFVVTPRARTRPAVRLGVPFLALLVALALGAVVLAATGGNPAEAYRAMFSSSLQGWRPMTRTLAYATPLLLTGLAAAVAFRMRLYNIGAEGQLIAGAIGASGLALALPPELPTVVMITAVMVGGAVTGALWAGLAAIPKARFGTDEIITTLMLNFIALGLMNYLIEGSMSFWRNPTHPVPQGESIPASARLPILSERLHAGFLIAVVTAAALWLAMRSSTWGFRIRTIGDSPRAARYGGISVGAMTVAVMGVSGALAGLAGAIEVSAVTRGLEPRALAIDLGYTGIIIAAVARFNPLGVVPVAIFLAAITTSGSSLQSVGVPSELVMMLQGLIFLSVTAGEFFVTNRVRLARRIAPTLEPRAQIDALLAEPVTAEGSHVDAEANGTGADESLPSDLSSNEVVR